MILSRNRKKRGKSIVSMRGGARRKSDESFFRTDPPLRVYGREEGASFQVIILGSSGGPREDTITGLLVRSPSTQWRKSSVIAVDAGAHLASILRILEHHMPKNSDTLPEKGFVNILKDGPFAGVRFPNISARANALFFFRELLNSFLITHPHLDHLSGLAINTPALEYGRGAKAIVALPSAIEAIKNHIFNDSIWPNLSDEEHGVGFVTYRRLIEGGNPRLGIGEARGYVNVCEGLATKCWSVSHGRCKRRSHSMSMNGGHIRDDSFNYRNASQDGYEYPPPRRPSRIQDDHGYIQALAAQHIREPSQAFIAPTPSGTSSAIDNEHGFEPVNSSAFFIRNDETGHEILVFGDIEPDSVSISPRNHIVWEDCAYKIVKGQLNAIFIECSYDDTVQDSDLYGHLCPRHLTAELCFLAQRVMTIRRHSGTKLQGPPTSSEVKRKRKRTSPTPNGDSAMMSPFRVRSTPLPPPSQPVPETPTRKRRETVHPTPVGGRRTPLPPLLNGSDLPDDTGAAAVGSGAGPPELLETQTYPRTYQGSPPLPKDLPGPLAGLTVHVIHVKDKLLDGPSQGDIILGQLREHGKETGLGCEFDVTTDGESIWI